MAGSDLGRWKVQEIVFMAILGPFALLACLEWFLWISCFSYCLCRTFRKGDHRTSKGMSVLMILVFIMMRAIFLPTMIFTLPFPEHVLEKFPESTILYLRWFALGAFALLLTLPWLLCAFRLATNTISRKPQLSELLNEETAPKTVVVMPIYKEHPDVLLAAINSVVASNYPSACIHVFMSFDGDDIDELYLTTADRLGIPITIRDFPVSIDVVYNGVRVTLSRFPHGGKRSVQKLTFKLIDKVYEKYLRRHDDLFILFIDSDCVLDSLCIQNFMWEMELKPGRQHPMLAMTGVITTTTAKRTLLTLLQDIEYLHGQLYDRSAEAACGAVTCLPGALTILRFSAFRNIARYYFADQTEVCEDLFDYGKCHLGEDRWLTHLFMIGARKRYQIGLCTNAFCKTEAVQTFHSLLKQRRRWFLGFITNEVCLLTDTRLWRKYSVLCFLRLMQNTIRTTTLLFGVMMVSIATTSDDIKTLPVGFIAVSLGLNYLLMLYFGIKLRRFKAWAYPLAFLIYPLINWLTMFYAVVTAGQRTWGGPRADAAAAAVDVSPQQAIEAAENAGDELNIVPETFRPAIEAAAESGDTRARRRIRRARRTTLQPSGSVEGRFESIPAVLEQAVKRIEDEDGMEVESDSDASFLQTPIRVTSLMGAPGPGPRGSNIEPADPQELSRRLTILAGRGSGVSGNGTGTGSGSNGPGPGPSPLGSECV